MRRRGMSYAHVFDLTPFSFCACILAENKVLTSRSIRLLQPIHAPGAVQGFGVLIAVEEDDETGNLIVRQVSEVK